jgi:hypothetical protein
MAGGIVGWLGSNTTPGILLVCRGGSLTDVEKPCMTRTRCKHTAETHCQVILVQTGHLQETWELYSASDSIAALPGMLPAFQQQQWCCNEAHQLRMPVSLSSSTHFPACYLRQCWQHKLQDMSDTYTALPYICTLC